MADVNRGNRPLSPHLQIYRPQLNSATSIFTRITGNALLLGSILVVWWLLAASYGGEYFETADWVLTSFVGDLIMLGSAWALWYHLLAGLRHLIWDAGYGLDVKSSDKMSLIIIGGSLFLTLFTIAIV